MPPTRPADDEVPDSPALVRLHPRRDRRFGPAGGWALMWNDGGLSCGLRRDIFLEALRRSEGMRVEHLRFGWRRDRQGWETVHG